ncbi:MAG: tRNA (adenosine(37)-N6)-dimethylallyltransferase MiaA [Epsilonproteobacteria bacterium]|nr:tRNA (adenosine(37)-N6)-dimethylallyltransferase MiaA [Campylobacterota bacterium]
MKEIAIIGVTASGKSDLAIELALKHNAYILSLDSLSIYKEIDIASAKPLETKGVKHFGIDLIYPDEYFSVGYYFEIYKQAKQKAKEKGKNLIVVGGSSFYLKALLQGLSPLPQLSPSQIETVQQELKDLPRAYEKLKKIDPSLKISPSDRYRIEKALTIYLATGTAPSLFFKHNPPKKVTSLKIFEILVEKSLLKKRVFSRTQKMLEKGLIDEVISLERKYPRSLTSMKAIGIKEVLEYLDGKVSKKELLENISLHTLQLAKRQRTFNRTQFLDRIALPQELLKEKIEEELKRET